MNAPTRPVRRPLSVEDYRRMDEAGIFAPDERIELIEGEIIAMPPIGPDHASTVARLTRLLVQAVGEEAIVRVQNPVRLSRFSEPQPDLCLLVPRDDDALDPSATATLPGLSVPIDLASSFG